MMVALIGQKSGNHLGNAIAAGSGSADFLISAQHERAGICSYARDEDGHSRN
jgi:hypothetical protein